MKMRLIALFEATSRRLYWRAKVPKCLDKFEPNFPLEKIVQGVLDTTTFMEPTFTCQRGTEIQCQGEFIYGGNWVFVATRVRVEKWLGASKASKS